MGDIRGFLKTERKDAGARPVEKRLEDFAAVCLLPADAHTQDQASRCMDCGTPFCHWACPVGNYIPEWNDLVFRGQWEKAFLLLQATNNFPEITGRICPAPCEYSCVLGINDDPVTIRENELAIIEYAFCHDIVKPRPPQRRSGKNVAVIGSGPAGLACADQLNQAGHRVTVFEKADKIGGILRYGIPDFKLEKRVLDRRLGLLEAEGVIFKAGIFAGRDIKAAELKKGFDAFCLAGGSSVPRDLPITGRDLTGIYFAMDYLVQSNRRVAGEKIPAAALIDAKDKRLVIIGGGDTGADCLGLAHRQKAKSVLQIEIMPKPASCRTPEYAWPKYPLILKISTSHEEGGGRQWSVLTKKFAGEGGCLRKLSCVRVEIGRDAQGCPLTREIPGSEFQLDADMVILALGFLHPEKKGLVEELGLDLDNRGNIKTGGDFMTSAKGIFSCGDMHRGQSLVVWAVSEGRQAAHHIDKYLMGESFLPAY